MPVRNPKTPLSQRQLAIINLLPVGDENPRTTQYIADLLNTNVRAIRHDIHTLITQHSVPIGSKREGNPGYFLIENEAQKQDTIRPFIRQVDNELARTNALQSINISDFYAKKKAGAFTE